MAFCHVCTYSYAMVILDNLIPIDESLHFYPSSYLQFSPYKLYFCPSLSTYLSLCLISLYACLPLSTLHYHMTCLQCMCVCCMLWLCGK